MAILVLPENSGSILLRRSTYAVRVTLSVAEKAWPAFLTAVSCLMNALRTPGTSTLAPAGIDLGRKTASEMAGSSQVVSQIRTSMGRFGEGMAPIEGSFDKMKKSATKEGGLPVFCTTIFDISKCSPGSLTPSPF